MNESYHFYLNNDVPELDVKKGDVTLRFGDFHVVENIESGSVGSDGLYIHDVTVRKATDHEICLVKLQDIKWRLRGAAAFFLIKYGYTMTKEEQEEWYSKYVKFDRSNQNGGRLQ